MNSYYFQQMAQMRHAKLFNSIPPEALAAYNRANAEFAARLAKPADNKLDLDAPTTKAAAVVVNASDRLAEKITQKHQEQQQSGSRKLADGDRRYEFDETTDALAAAMERARARK